MSPRLKDRQLLGHDQGLGEETLAAVELKVVDYIDNNKGDLTFIGRITMQAIVLSWHRRHRLMRLSRADCSVYSYIFSILA